MAFGEDQKWLGKERTHWLQGSLGLLHGVKYGVTLDHNQKKEWNPIFPEKL